MTVIYNKVGLVTKVHCILDDAFMEDWHDMEDRIVVVLNAFVGQYFNIWIVRVVFVGIFTNGVTDTIIEEGLVVVVNGFAVIEHVRTP